MTSTAILPSDDIYYGEVVIPLTEESVVEPEIKPRRRFGRRQPNATSQAAPRVAVQPHFIEVWLVTLPYRHSSSILVRDQMEAAASTIQSSRSRSGLKLYVSDNHSAVRSSKILGTELSIQPIPVKWLAIGEGSQSDPSAIRAELARLPVDGTIILAYSQVISQILTATGTTAPLAPGEALRLRIELGP